jgi:hypothetical protein
MLTQQSRGWRRARHVPDDGASEQRSIDRARWCVALSCRRPHVAVREPVVLGAPAIALNSRAAAEVASEGVVYGRALVADAARWAKARW